MEKTKRCTRPGCGKEYKDSENTDTSCKFHNGKVLFHDTKKGWTCCNQVVYDFEEFQKIEGCCVGRHTDETTDTTFFKSDTVANAAKALEKEAKAVKIKSIDEYNKEQEAKRKAEEEKKKAAASAAPAAKKPVIRDGLYLCANMGCNKNFDEKDNNETACKYHSGAPCFHDGKKSWTCCKGDALDWDEFMKLPTCCTGKHTIALEISQNFCVLRVNTNNNAHSRILALSFMIRQPSSVRDNLQSIVDAKSEERLLFHVSAAILRWCSMEESFQHPTLCSQNGLRQAD